MKILVVGAQGMLGRPVVRRLVQDGFAVRALARDPAKARARLPAAVEILAGDLREPASIDRALEGCAAVYLSVDHRPGDRFQPETDGLANVITAARNHAGVRLMTMTGLRASDPASEKHPREYIREKFKAYHIARHSGLSWTVWEPTWFMESIPLFAKGQTMIFFGGVRLEPWWVAGDDYARRISRALSTGSEQERAVPVQGPEKVPWAEAARRFAKAWGPPMQVRRMPFVLLRALGVFSADARKLAAILKISEQVNEPAPDPALWHGLGGLPLSIEGYADYVRRIGDFPQK